MNSSGYYGDDVEKADGPVDFEQAIKLTGYGKFNYLLLLAILPAGCAFIYSSTAMSYVLPSAECDLGLTLFDKGLLNSMPFAGMIVTSFIWGFLTDTFGRKHILIYGYLTVAIINLASALSQTSWLLIMTQFLNGVVMSGPFAALMSYLAEVHGEQQRSRIYMWLGVFYSIGHISIPCLAWLIIPQEWRWNIFGGTTRVTSWRIFLAVCAIPEIAAFVALSWFPESPRFLLSKGRDQEALEVFKKIYTLNTGNEPHTYPLAGVCAPVVLDSTVYINSIVIALTGVVGYTLAGTLINAAGKKKLMVFCFLSAGLCCGVLYWAEDSNGILGISSVFVALSSIGGAAVMNVIVDNFPTSLRTMAISMTMMAGRVGAVVGNLLFPVLFKVGCLGPFVMIGSACLVCSILVFFLPRKEPVSDKSAGN